MDDNTKQSLEDKQAVDDLDTLATGATLTQGQQGYWQALRAKLERTGFGKLVMRGGIRGSRGHEADESSHRNVLDESDRHRISDILKSHNFPPEAPRDS